MKNVKISDLFEVKYGNGFELVNMDICEENTNDSFAFISRTSRNNGISAFVEKITDVKSFQAGLITVSVGGSVLETFLQKKPFYTGFHIMVLKPKLKMSDIEKLFYCYCIRQNKYRYNYGRQANKTLKDILIPEEIPDDWRDLSIERLNNLNAEPLINSNIALGVSSWGSFNLSGLFDIKGSVTTPLLELEEYGRGEFPYVTTQATNNGIEGSYDYYTEEGGVLTVDSAVLGYCSYQPYNFSASDHVEELIPKFKMNKYIAMFLVTIINKEQYRYNYGRKCSQDRMKKRSVKLPTKNGQPDWQLMEDCIKSLSYSSSL